MKIEDIKKKLPNTPGVYFFLGPRKEIFYIGKATSLRDRMRSYFTGDLHGARSKLIVEMVENAKSVDFRKTDSVLEALILEASLIKTHKPKYNTRDKDNKSFNYVVITKEDFPRVLIVRGHDLYKKFDESEIKYFYGPFVRGGLFKDAMKLIRKIFPFYDTKQPVTKLRKSSEGKKVVFNQQIGLYPHPDTTKKDYNRTIQHLKLFFEGKKKQLIRQLGKEMKEYANNKEFEKAQEIKRRLFALQHIQDIALIKEEFRTPKIDLLNNTFRIESYDIAHMAGRDMVGVMTVVENGEPKKSDYRKFKIREVKGINDTASLQEVVSRRLNHAEWPMPRLIVVDGGVAQKNAVKKVLIQAGVEIPVVSVVKDERHRPREILGDKKYRQKYEREILLANAEAHRFAINYHRKKSRKIL